MMRSGAGAFAILLLPLSALAGSLSAGAAPAERAKRGGTVRVATVEPTGIAPGRVRDTNGDEIARLLNVGLVDLDPKLRPIPGVASSWDVSSDATAFTFHLRPDARFSNGRAITARDFEFAARRAADPDSAIVALSDLHIVGVDEARASPLTEQVGDVTVLGVRAIDDRTLQIRTTEPASFLPSRLAGFAAVPAELFESSPDGQGYDDQPLGNGPYRMRGPWRHNDAIELVRNERYWRTPGRADRIDFRIFSNAETAYREVQAGNIDLGAPPPGQESAARAEFGDRYIQTAAATIVFIGLPLHGDGFDDVAVRRAASLAIDREAIASRLLSGTAVPARGIVPPLAPEAKRNSCPDCRYDPKQARRLYRRSRGVPNDKITAFYPAGVGYDEAAQAVGNDIRKALGVDVVFQPTEAGEAFAALQRHQIDGPFGFAWAASFLSAYDFLAPLFETSAPDNYAEYSNPRFDDLMGKARRAGSFEELRSHLRAAQDIIGRDLPVIPLVFPSTVRVTSTRITNVTIDASSEARLERVTVVR